jgi:hypothetical protein
MRPRMSLNLGVAVAFRSPNPMSQIGNGSSHHKESFDMLRKIRLNLVLAAAFVTAVAIAVPHAAAAGDDVPSNLQVPEGHQAYLIGHAYGTQNYTCVLAASGFTWAFHGPQATLFDEANEQLTTHYLSPNPAQNGAQRATWQHSGDTSTVWAAAIASSTDPDFVAPGAIPWLLLKVMGAQGGPTGGTTLTQTTFIQRVNTIGGIAPATGCRVPEDIGKKAMVPYTTDYIFYRQ